MRTNEAGLALIREFEGCALHAYKDPVGVWTIGYGWTEGVRPGMVITEAAAELLLIAGIKPYEMMVQSMFAPIPLNDNEFSALVSFCYNLGATNLSRSTLAEKLRKGRPRAEVAERFKDWNKARVNGALKVLPGLVRRRRAERDLFLKPISEGV